MPARLPRKRFGAFIAPFHPDDENPTEQIHRDFELVELLDRLGYHEAWIGEHHSAGFEIIDSPELFIAQAAATTRNIRLGTFVHHMRAPGTTRYQYLGGRSPAFSST